MIDASNQSTPATSPQPGSGTPQAAAPEPPAPPPKPKRRGKQRQNGGRKAGQGRWSRNPNKTGGRPSDYRKANDRLALRFSKLGLTDEKIAEAFSVSIGTFYRWKKEHPAFKKAVEVGRLHADGEVVESAYQSAVGYKHPDEVIAIDTKTGAVHRARTVKHYPPNIGAAAMILKAHHPDKWREKSAVELSGPGGAALTPSVIVISREEVSSPPPAPAIDLPPAAVRIGPAGGVTVEREAVAEPPGTPQDALGPVPAALPAPALPNAPQAKPGRAMTAVAREPDAPRPPERRLERAALDGGAAAGLLEKLAALGGVREPDGELQLTPP